MAADRKLTPADVEYLKEAYNEGWSTQEIGDSLGIHSATVSKVAHEQGCIPRMVRPSRKHETALPIRPVSDIDTQIEKLREEQKRTEMLLRKYESLKKIDFVYDADEMKVTITGVDRFFIIHEGLAKFREWLVKQFSV